MALWSRNVLSNEVWYETGCLWFKSFSRFIHTLFNFLWVLAGPLSAISRSDRRVNRMENKMSLSCVACRGQIIYYIITACYCFFRALILRNLPDCTFPQFIPVFSTSWLPPLKITSLRRVSILWFVWPISRPHCFSLYSLSELLFLSQLN